MKNLFVNKSVEFDVQTPVSDYCVDVDNGALFVFTQDFRILKMDTKCPNAKIENVDFDFNFKSIGMNQMSKGEIIKIEFIVESGSLLIVCKSGFFLQIGVSSYSPPSGCIYKHNFSVSSIKISPHQDLIALADDQNNIHIMSMDCTSLHSSNSLTQNDSLHKPVGVGWGSKETQFFGLDGRPSKEGKRDEVVDMSEQEVETIQKIETSALFREIRRQQEVQTVIDWRGDGQLLGTLTFLPETDKHYLKVWNRNLELQYMSEQLVTVERGILSWVPDGKYLCCAQRRDMRINDIAMFEKNGMVHQRLTLPTILKDLYIKDICWSGDSNILAIITYQFIVEQDEVEYQPILLLYTMQNFHYYLKYSAHLRKNCEHNLKWDPISSNRFRIVSSDGHYVEYECNSEVSFSEDLSTIAVVDANQVLLTPMKACNIPPPLFALNLRIEALIHKIIIDSHDASNIIIITLDNNVIFSVPNHELRLEKPLVKLDLIVKIASALFDKLQNLNSVQIDDVSSLQHIVPIAKGCFIGSRMVGNDSHLVKVKLLERGMETLTVFQNKQVGCIASSEDSTLLKILLDDCECVTVDVTNPGDKRTSFEFHPTTAHTKISVIYAQTVKLGLETLLVTLSHDLTLRVDEDVIAFNTCTSFRTSENYLIYTTTDHHMHFILIKNLAEKKDRCKVGSWSQPIENTGTLVIVSEQDAKVVLQMQRGNLEIVHPRILVLSSLTVLLDNGSFVEAMKLARRHRLNLNFICDYLIRLSADADIINRFANEVASFDPSSLNVFISEMNSEDTIDDRYCAIIKHLPKKIPKETKLKVDEDAWDKLEFVCNSIELPSTGKYLEPRLLCHLHRCPPNFDGALKEVYSLEESLKEPALKFILYLVDIDILFNHALRTYDTNIAIMVASVSNKDPKEYLALLDKFNQIEDPFRRRFEIDTHVGSYTASLVPLLEIIFKSNEKEPLRMKFIDLIASKRLHRQAIELMQKRARIRSEDDEVLLERTWSKYGDYLLEKRYHTEAGVAYSKALNLNSCEEHLNSALKCFLLVDNWEISLAALTRCKLSDSIKKNFYEKISKQLMESGKCIEAATVAMLKYNQSSLVDAESLIRKGSWYLAECFSANSSSIFPAVWNALEELERNLQKELKTAGEHFERLKVLLRDHHESKVSKPSTENYISDTLSTVDGSEVSSLSASSDQQKVARSGASSIRTRTSSKSSSRSQKKRRINLKAGSRYEDIALVLELREFLSRQKQNHETISRLLASLFTYSNDDQSSVKIQSRLLQILEKMLSLSATILDLLWPSTPASEQTYSLYRRFSDALSSEKEIYENDDFLVLIRPDIPKEVNCFDFLRVRR